MSGPSSEANEPPVPWPHRWREWLLISPRQVAVGLVSGLAVLLASGLVLAFLYETDPDTAWDALVDMQAGPLGWLRGLHGWMAWFVFVAAAFHGVRSVLWDRVRKIGFRRAFAGGAMFLLVLLALATGSVLTWDVQGWGTYEHLEGALHRLPGWEHAHGPEEARLDLAFWAHVALIPLGLVIGLTYHLRRYRTDKAWTRLSVVMRRHGRDVLVVAGAGLVLSALLPHRIGDPAISWDGSYPLGPAEWPFLWLEPLGRWFGSGLFWFLPSLFAVGLFVVARPPRLSDRGRHVAMGCVIGLFLVLTWMGWRLTA